MPDWLPGSWIKREGLPRLSFGGIKHPLDPNEYQHAKRRLRKAVVEHYRCVEMFILQILAVVAAGVAHSTGNYPLRNVSRTRC
jgi:hypothetical protein